LEPYRTNTIWGQIEFIDETIKQCENPQSTSLVEEKEGQDRKGTGINKESGSERAAALSRTVRHRVPPEFAQPPDGTKSEGLLTSAASDIDPLPSDTFRPIVHSRKSRFRKELFPYVHASSMPCRRHLVSF